MFEASHARVLQLIAHDNVTGLRIDHSDGLLDPASYFVRLERAIAAVRPHGGNDDAPDAGFPILAEKILGHGEFLPAKWPIAGTTGYGFLNAVSGLFVDGDNEDTFRRLYARLTGRRESLAEVAYESKRLVMGSSLASEVGVLTRFLKQIALSDRRTRDLTLTTLRRAIVEAIACLPVYRTYISASGFSATDRHTIDLAIDRAQRRNPVIAPSAFFFLRRVLLADGEERDDYVQSHRQFAMKFQQLSSPVQAKGVEDTCFYRYNALMSLNEVGGDPGRFGTPVEEFHDGNRVRLERWPREMIATSTHDTKRGEDARARLNVLSEMPAQWRLAFSDWRTINAPHRTAVDRRSAPDPNDEYLFYQALVGSWPAEPGDGADSRRGAGRIRGPPAGVHAEGDQRGQDAYQLVQSERAVRRRRLAIRRDRADGTGGAAISGGVRPVRPGRGGRRHAELAVAAGAENGVARRPRLLPGDRNVAAGHGRPRQPPAGRFCRSRGGARRADAVDPAGRVRACGLERGRAGRRSRSTWPP